MAEKQKKPKNEMQVLAEVSFFATDAAKGLVGKWDVEEDGWGQGDLARAVEEFQDCLRILKEAGFVDKPKIAQRAPFTANIQTGCFYKKFPGLGERWIAVTLATRFGFSSSFEVCTTEPWT